MRFVAAEIGELLEPLIEIVNTNGPRAVSEDPALGTGVLVFHESVHRNKRCVLAYLMNRLRRIQTYRWEAGAVAANHLSENMSAAESTFLTQYNKLLGSYCSEVDLDITADAQPPKDLYIEVRVLADCGSVETDAGPVTLKPGTAHFLKRADVEPLIRQGLLEHVQ